MLSNSTCAATRQTFNERNHLIYSSHNSNNSDYSEDDLYDDLYDDDDADCFCD